MRPAALALFLALSAAGAAACSSGDCGPGDAPPDGVLLEAEGRALTFGAFTSSPNNDCPAMGHPTSLTITGEQVDPAPETGAFLTLCLPRPDEIGAEPIPLDDADRIVVVDLGGELDGCRLNIDRSQDLSGTATFAGFCRDGTAEAGYALELDATVPGVRSCPADGGTTEDPVTMTLSGRAAIEAL